MHPGADLAAVIRNIEQHFVAVKKRRELTHMASGLWLSEQVVSQLQSDKSALPRFQETLQQAGVQLTSLNGFPFGDFHQAVVKQKVYLPTWAEAERLTYTKNLAVILAECLPANEPVGAISTLPLAYAQGWTTSLHGIAVEQLLDLVAFLGDLENQTGKQIQVCIEMEPDCVLQETHELVKFFTDDLLPNAELRGIAQNTVLRHLGCCYDTCHQAVMGEDISLSLQQITNAGIKLGKIQISNAVKASLHNKQQATQLTELFADNKFLHQTKVFEQGQFQQALTDLALAPLVQVLEQCQGKIETTIHYHIPVNQSATDLPLPFLQATQYAILQTLDFLQQHPEHRPFLEIETYTWLNFLQQGLNKTERLHQGFELEFNWLESALESRGLLA